MPKIQLLLKTSVQKSVEIGKRKLQCGIVIVNQESAIIVVKNDYNHGLPAHSHPPYSYMMIVMIMIDRFSRHEHLA